MSQTAQPNPGYPANPAPGAPVPPSPQDSTRGNAMAITGFVVAVVALVLCFIPIINNFAFFLALVGLVFGIIGLVRTRKGAPRKGLAIASIIIAVLSGAGVLASQAFYSSALDSLSDDLDAATGTDSESPAAADDAAADDVTTDKAEAEGTRENPYAFGQQVSNDDWTVDLGKPKLADDIVKKENPYNEAPADGMEFWMVPVEATYTGAETGWPAMDISVAFVGDDAKTYNDSCGVIPDDLMDVDELYEGGQAEGNVCVQVPKGAEGTWTLTAGLLGENVFFSTAA